MLNNPKDIPLCIQMLSHIEVILPLKDNLSPRACHSHWEIYYLSTECVKLPLFTSEFLDMPGSGLLLCH